MIWQIFFIVTAKKKNHAPSQKNCAARAAQAITTTAQLSQLVVEAIGRHGKHHPATRVFQALRIAVNNELAEVVAGLEAAEKLLKKGGRLVAISFHSLEDKIIKDFFKTRADNGKGRNPSRHLPSAMTLRDDNGNGQVATFAILTKKPITAGADELAQNPRSRSAKLRAAMKITQPSMT